MSAAAFLAGERGACDGFGNEQHVFEVAREVPAGIEHTRAVSSNAREAGLEFVEFGESFFQIFRVAENADEVLHRFLKVVMNRVRKFAAGAFEGSEHLAFRLFELRRIKIGCGRAIRKFSGGFSGASAEDKKIRK